MSPAGYGIREIRKTTGKDNGGEVAAGGDPCYGFPQHCTKNNAHTKCCMSVRLKLGRASKHFKNGIDLGLQLLIRR